jgi:thiol-disulfide isomerase/thioredoxin
MGPRTTIAAGLISGAAVALALLIAVVLLLPEPAASGPSASPSIGPSGAGPAASGTPPASQPASAPPSTGASNASTFHVGEKAPALSLPQLGGGTVSLAALAGKPVWVNFMQTTCPPCRDEFPLMNGFAARYAAAGLVVVAVDVREDEGTIAAFAQQMKAQFPVALDADGSAQRAWDAVALPVHFWVDRDGVIRAGALGGIGPDEMATQLGTILPGVTVTP